MHSISATQILKTFGVNKEKGLKQESIPSLVKKYGKNILLQKKKITSLEIIIEQFKSPLMYILLGAGFITLALHEYTDSAVIFLAVAINTIFGFIQEKKASNTLEKLRKIVKIEAKVLRDSNIKIINSCDLVPGDIVILDPGEKVPADGRLLSTKELTINEAPLSGEWIPSLKNTKVLDIKTPLADRDNMAYMGTVIESGYGVMVVIGIGNKTEIGKISETLESIEEEKTPYQKKIIELSKFIGIFISVSSIIIFVIGYFFRGYGFSEMFLTTVAVAVSAIPEGLPVAMTVILAVGMQKILKKKGLVRKLASAETLGSTSVICTDKTGTLTQGIMKLDFASGDNTLRIAGINAEVFVENHNKPLHELIVRGRPTDRALFLGAMEHGIDIKKDCKEISRVPFRSTYKFSATLLKESKTKNVLYVLGAPEKILAMVSRNEINNKTYKISKKRKEEIQKEFQDLAKQGKRVLACAYKKVKAVDVDKKCFDLCDDLIYTGLVSLVDPLREDVKGSISKCRSAGMRVIMATGDNKFTAMAIANEIGFNAEEKNLIEGNDLDLLSDKELGERLEDIKIFARVTPEHKMRIIDAWQNKGEVVAMTGDGINDAPALKLADIGVALGSGTEVAKEASDLILLNNNFSVIVDAIERGRGIIDNIRKVMTYLLSDSFTEILLVAFSVITGNPLPLTAIQILWVNLVEDGLPNTALAFEPMEDDLMEQKPMKRNASLINLEMKEIILIVGLVTDALLLGLFWYLLQGKYPIEYIQTMIFACLTVDSLFYVFSCKSLRKNIWEENLLSNKFLVFSWFVGIIMLYLAIYNPFLSNMLNTVALGFNDWIIIFAMGFVELFLIEMVKMYFIRKKKFD